MGCPKTKTKKQSQHDSHSSRSCQKSSENGSFKYILPFSPFEPFAPSHYPSTTSQEFLALMCEHTHFEPSHSGLVSQWAQWTYGSGSFRQYCQCWGVSRLQRHTLPVRQRYLGHVKRCHWRFHFFWKRCVWDWKMASGKKRILKWHLFIVFRNAESWKREHCGESKWITLSVIYVSTLLPLNKKKCKKKKKSQNCKI